MLLALCDTDQLSKFKSLLEAFLDCATDAQFASCRDQLLVTSEADRNRLFKLADFAKTKMVYRGYLAAIEPMIDGVCRQIAMSQAEIDLITVYENRHARFGFGCRTTLNGYKRLEEMAMSLLERVDAEIEKRQSVAA